MPVSAQSDSRPQDVTIHEKSSDCVTGSGLLLCTCCREQEGLLPLLTPGNADWRLPPQDLDSNVRYVTASIVSDDDDDDDDEDEDQKKKKGKQRATKSDNRKKEESKSRSRSKSRHPPFSGMPGHMPIPGQRGMSPMQWPMGAPGFMQSVPRHMSGSHGAMPNPMPMNPEYLELLKNINGTLKSIESMMRDEQNARSRSNNDRPMPPSQSGSWRNGPGSDDRQMQFAPPRNAGPRDGGPRDGGPRSGDGMPRGR